MSGSCAMDCHEPCQAGNRAALSGFFRAPQLIGSFVRSSAFVFLINFFGGYALYQALYRKYRPSTFDEVVGQEHITLTLKNQLEQGRVFHAYLFTGTRGTGKTSCAKILAKAVNCLNSVNGEPCGECESCREIASGEVMDILEIDAASNNGVDDIRALRDQVNFTPAKAKYRVYIIDEVHMLSLNAFNALLKTLEEPPAHVVFILATTEVHKLPATILSRCERFDFKRISSEHICARIKEVCNKENLKISDEAARLIANVADGGMRDALSVLDLCAAAESDISEQTVASVCGMAGKNFLFRMVDAISIRDAAEAVSIIEEIHCSSSGVSRFISDLTSYIRDLLLIKTLPAEKCPVTASSEEMLKMRQQAEGFTNEELLGALDILCAALNTKYTDAKITAQMTVIRLCRPVLASGISALEARVSALEKKLKSGISVLAAPAAEKTAASTPAVEIIKNISNNNDYIDEIPLPEKENYPAAEGEKPVKQVEGLPKSENDLEEDVLFTDWNLVLESLKTTCPLIVGVLAGSSAYIRNDMLLIDCPNSQFRSLLGANPTYRIRIKESVAEITGKSFRLGPYQRPTSKSEKTDPLKSLANKLDMLGAQIK